MPFENIVTTLRASFKLNSWILQMPQYSSDPCGYIYIYRDVYKY